MLYRHYTGPLQDCSYLQLMPCLIVQMWEGLSYENAFKIQKNVNIQALCMWGYESLRPCRGAFYEGHWVNSIPCLRMLIIPFGTRQISHHHFKIFTPAQKYALAINDFNAAKKSPFGILLRHWTMAEPGALLLAHCLPGAFSLAI